MAKYVTTAKLSTYWAGIVENLTKGVNGKKLTTNDLTDELKTKYDAAQANVIESITVNNAAQAVGEGKTVNITVPTTVAQLTDASSYYTSAQTDSKIAAAVTGKLKKEVVDVLPAVEDADDSTIYMVPNENAEGENIRDEYMLINGKFEVVGTTATELSGYIKVTDEATDEEIMAIFENYTPPTGE
jgi:hypothetical protein